MKKLNIALATLLVSTFTQCALAADDNISVNQQGAIADSLYYQIGGGPLSRLR